MPLSPTHTSSKKRKSHTGTASPSKKKQKKSLEEDNNNVQGEFHVINASVVLSVPPIFVNNPRAGVEEMLDSMVMRYIPAFRGVALSHSNLSFINKQGLIKADCPFLICNVGFDVTVWSPNVGMKLVGKVNLCSPDHVSLLIHRTFNAAIPRHHIPLDHWEFEYGPAENDPEFGPAVQEKEDAGEDSEEKESGGKWVHRLTGEKLGGVQGYLEFTVIGLTVANEMLSLQGSLQPDPFSPRHAAQIHARRRTEEAETDIERIEAELEEAENVEDNEASSDVDTFKALGLQTVRAIAADKRKRKSEETEQQSEAPKKRKRKGGKEKQDEPSTTKPKQRKPR